MKALVSQGCPLKYSWSSYRSDIPALEISPAALSSPVSRGCAKLERHRNLLVRKETSH